MQDEKHLSTTERVRFEQYEKIIERGRQTFVEVGNALMAIRDKRLYRASHATFEDYCRERWGWSARHASRQIEAAEIAGEIGPIGPKPTHESQVRPLASLPPDEQASAWNEATKSAPEGRVTERHVREVVERRRKLEPERQAKVDEFKARILREATEGAEERPATGGAMDDLIRRIDAQILQMQEAAKRFSHLALSGGSDNEVQTGMLDLIQRYVLSFESPKRRVEVAHNLIKALRVLIHEVNGSDEGEGT